MRYYKSRRKSSVNVRKILFRVLFTVIAAAVIFGITVAVGKGLQKKVRRVEENEVELPSASAGLQTERRIEESAIYDEYSPTVFGTAINVSDYLTPVTDEDGKEYMKNVAEDVKTIAKDYDTLSIRLTDRSGALIYQSAAMCDLTRMPHDDGDESEEIIRDALAEAKKHSLRTCAVVTPVLGETTISGAAAIDSALITELNGMGFDEVLFDLTGTFSDTVDYETANRVRTYLHECSSMSEEACKLGVVLSGDVFLNSANAKQIQVIANAASFVAVWFNLDEVYITTNAYNMISDAVTSLLGNFSVYNMRVVIDSRFTLISGAVYIACTTHGVNNVMFSSYIEPSELTYADLPTAGKGGETADDEDSTDSAAKENPYATTKDNPSIGAPEKDVIPDFSSDKGDGNGDDISPKPWY